MKPIFRAAFIATLVASSAVHAKDSLWLVCSGIAEVGAKPSAKTHVVASMFEHRSAKLGGRDVSLTLIYGDRLGRGEIVGDADITHKLELHVKTLERKPQVLFAGTAELVDDERALVLHGTFDRGDGGKPFAARLLCEEQDDDAIGHSKGK